MSAVSDRLEPLVLRLALGLTPSWQRRLAGRPVVLDGQTLSIETQLMLRLQQAAKLPAAESLPIPEGRIAIDHQSAAVAGSHPVGSVEELEVAGLPARLYTPTTTVGTGPLLVFFHGGGFMYGGLASHDAPCRVLCERAKVRVLAVDYRLAPEHPFPAAYDDAVAAYRWVVEHAEELYADPDRLAVGGDSAGGNLAAGVATVAAQEKLPLAFQLLIYPATDNARATRSLELFSEGFFLTRRFMELATESYLPDGPAEDPRASPAYADVPEGLAPAYVCTAGFDPLRDEGEAYVARLREAGVTVRHRRFADQIHGFFNVVGAGVSAPSAVKEIADELRRGLKPKDQPKDQAEDQPKDQAEDEPED